MDAVKSLHPTDEMLALFGHGKLEETSSETIGRHVDQCEDCQKRVGELSSDSFLGKIRGARNTSGASVAGASMVDATLSFAQPSPPAGPPPAAETIPTGLAEHADYQIKRELGRGGMGVVYLAHNWIMGRDEVLKVMNKNIIEKPGVLERFQREIRAVAKLRHPNIVAAYTAFRIDGGLVFAMEYVDGLDLAKMVKLKGPLPVLHASYFAHQAALGLQHAHERGMIHRDIKPHNLMLTGDGKARIIKVLDFGLAKASLEREVDTSLTREGQALGTPDYIAPEQILNAVDVDIRADIYSLGATLYYLLTGRPPFTASSLYDIYQAHISRDIDPINLLRPEVPAELAALVAKMMAKEPKRRFRSPAEVALALTPFFKKTAQPFPAPPAAIAPPSKPRREVPVARPPGPKQTANIPAKVAPPPPSVAPANVESVVAMPVEDDLAIRPAATPGSALVKPKRRRIKRPVYSAAVGLLSFGLFAWWLGTVRIKTENGTIVLEGLKDNNIVEVDGKAVPTITIKKTSEGAPYLTLTAEKHGIRVVTKDGTEILAKGDLVIQPNGLETLYVKPAAELNSLAWELATSDDASKRNGAKAVRLATSACEQDRFQSPIYLDTLAAAYAEVGDFDAAVKWEIQALAKEPGKDLYSYHKRLLLYRDKAPYRTGSMPGESNPLMWATISNSEAWELATNADPSKRDPARAYELAPWVVLNDHYENHGYIDTLAAACAARGAFDEAVMWQEKAIRFSPAHDVPEAYRKRLALYRQRKPYYQDPAPASDIPQAGDGTSTTDNQAVGVSLIPPREDRAAWVFSGAWQIEGDELVQSNADGRASIEFGDPSWSEYNLSVEVDSLHGLEGSWTIFHSIDVANTMNFYTGASGHRTHGLAVVSNGGVQHFRAPGTMAHNEWHTVKLVVRGASVACLFDGGEVLSRADLPHAHGRVGLGTYHTAARYRNIRITTPDGTVLWEGLPILP